MDPLLVVRELSVGYRDLTVVWDASLQVHPGRTTAIVGRNGAGKTTLVGGIAGLLRARAGSVHLGGIDITKLPPWSRAQRALGLVQEGKRVLRSLSVADNLTVATNGARLRRREAAERVDETYTRFPVLGSRRAQRAGSLSGGQQQLLAIAQALVARPKVLMIDEPSSGLAPVVVHEIFTVIQGLKAEGIGILLVEQLIDKVLGGIADDVVLLEGGRVVLAEEARNVSREQLAHGIFS